MNIEPLKPSWTGSHQIDYNTALPHLVLPEYGRNIQRMVNHAITIEDREERNKVAQAIIVVMGQLNPQLRDVTDFKHKLWDHLFIISEFKLDVDSPYPKPTPESFNTKPERVNYPSGSIRYKPYGKIAEEIIAQAQTVAEGEAKDYLIELVANLLKRSYLTWNRDAVNDEVILNHLAELSNGNLVLKDLSRLASTNEILARNKITPAPKQNNKGHRHDNKHGKFKRPFK